MSDTPTAETPLIQHFKKPSRAWCQQRYVMAFLASLGFFNVYCMRINLSVALVAMVNCTQEYEGNATTSECQADVKENNTTPELVGEFDWSPETQGVVLSSFFYGYVVMQIPGGLISERFGGKWPYGLGILTTGFLTLLIPLAARTSVNFLIVLRVLCGLGEGLTPAALQNLIGKWAPPLERSRLIVYSFIGGQFGTIVAMPVSGLLCHYGFAGGWPSVFYVFGTLACLWFILWACLVHSSPDEHPRISEKERTYINSSIGDTKKSASGQAPWLLILTCPFVWSLSLVQTGISYIYYTILTDLPTFMETILHFKINENSLLSAIPYTLYAVLGLTSGPLADWLISGHMMYTINVRRIFTAVGVVIPSAAIIAAGYIGCNYYLGVALLTISTGFLAFALPGYIANMIDFAPNYAGSIMGFINTFGTIAGIVAPVVVGIFTSKEQNLLQWRVIFLVAGVFNVASALPYFIFAKPGRAAWSVNEESPQMTETVTARQASLHTRKDDSPASTS
ncbi:sialin-like [Lineus longissimus]|uniref:sialin-like n=1 Tax=Lineus longissimus TaxID=88925 RepID=UPI002B4CFD05